MKYKNSKKFKIDVHTFSDNNDLAALLQAYLKRSFL